MVTCATNLRDGIEGMSHRDIWKVMSGSRNSLCKGPEVGARLMRSRNSKEANEV